MTGKEGEMLFFFFFFGSERGPSGNFLVQSGLVTFTQLIIKPELDIRPTLLRWAEQFFPSLFLFFLS